jgi:predicted permease
MLVDRLFEVDLNTLSKLNYYTFIPAIIFIGIYANRLESATSGEIVSFV